MSNQVENTLIEINSLSGWARRLRRRPTGSKKSPKGGAFGLRLLGLWRGTTAEKTAAMEARGSDEGTAP